MARVKVQAANKRKRANSDCETNDDQEQISKTSTASETLQVNLNLVELYQLDKEDLLHAILLDAIKKMNVSLIRPFDSWIRSRQESDEKFSTFLDSCMAEAVEKDNVEFVEYLLRFDLYTIYSSFTKAARCNNVQFLKMLHEYLVKNNRHPRGVYINALNVAAENNATLAMHALIEELFDYDQENYFSAIQYAIVSDNYEAIEYLYDYITNSFSIEQVKFAIRRHCSSKLFDFILTNSTVENNSDVDDLIKCATDYLLELITEDKDSSPVLDMIKRLILFKKETISLR